MQEAKTNRWLWGAWLLLAVAVAAVYGLGVGGPFFWDDLSLFDDARIHEPDGWLGWFWAPDDEPLSGRPVAMVTMVATHAAFGGEPTAFRVVNIGLHLACALLAGWVVYRTLTHQREAGQAVIAGERWAAWATLAIVALWALHPLQTEAVIYITQRTELLVSLFTLLTLACAIEGWRSEKAATRWHVAAAVACLLGVGSKENIVAAPILVLAWDRIFNQRSWKQMVRQSPVLYGGLVAACAVLAAVVLSEPRGNSTGWDHGVSALDYLRTQAEVIAWYVRLVFVPYPQVLAYEWPIRETWTWRVWPALPLALGFVAAVWGLWRQKAWGFALLVFYLVLAPTSSVLPIVTEVAAERRMYLPSLALISLCVAWAMHRWQARQGAGRQPTMAWAAAASVAAVLVLASLSAVRVSQYNDPLALWGHDVEHAPESSLAYEFWGAALQQAGRTEEAIAAYRQALELDHEGARAMTGVNLSILLGENGKLDESLRLAQKAATTKPPSAKAFNAVGIAYIRMNQPGLAVEPLEKSLALEPEFYSARTHMGMALLMLGRTEEAIAQIKQAAELEPGDLRAQILLGKAYARADRLADAVAVYERVLEADASNAEAHNGLGVVHAKQADYEAARRHFEKAIALDPEHGDALRNLQRLQALRAR